MAEALRIRKLADKSEEAVREHPMDHPDKWPLAGVEIVDSLGKPTTPPNECRVSTALVDKARAEGWVELVGENVVHRPGGPPDDLYRVTHTFKHADKLVFKTMSGEARYDVTHQPDKYVDTTDYAALGREPSAKPTAKADAVKVTDEHYAAGQTRVDWFYDLKLEA